MKDNERGSELNRSNKYLYTSVSLPTLFARNAISIQSGNDSSKLRYSFCFNDNLEGVLLGNPITR